MKTRLVTRTATMTVDGTVDLDSALTTHLDSVIKASAHDAAVTLASVADASAPNTGRLDETNYPAIVFYFKSGVTTVGNFETLIAASAHLEVVTPGTAADLLYVTDDDFTATALASGTMNLADDSCTVDVSDLTNVSIYVNQLTDSGTVNIVLEKSIDGVNWAIIDATVAHGDFAAGSNKSVEYTLSDGNGMPTLAKQIRATVSAYGASGVYSMAIAGQQVY